MESTLIWNEGKYSVVETRTEREQGDDYTPVPALLGKLLNADIIILVEVTITLIQLTILGENKLLENRNIDVNILR